MAEAQNIEIIYECTNCYAIVPYLSCPHNYPGDLKHGEDPEEEGFDDDMKGWLEDIKIKMKKGLVRLVEAPDPEVFELVPDQPGQPQGTIRADNDENHPE